MIRTYMELIEIPSFEERFEYLKLDGVVCDETFGCDRWLNQVLYNSYEWRKFRYRIIERDNGCDLAHPDRQLDRLILIHHINPITKEDIIQRRPAVFDLNNVVCTSRETHQAIHYGAAELILKDYEPRTLNDTCLWRN